MSRVRVERVRLDRAPPDSAARAGVGCARTTSALGHTDCSNKYHADRRDNFACC